LQFDGYWVHGLSANYLFGDGHVEAPKFYDTLTCSDGSLATVANVTETMWDSDRG